jgi:hypothetical protein
MANDEHVAFLKQGVVAWNRWREGTSEIPNLSNADLTSAELAGANLTDANLAYAVLLLANLTRADLTRADLAGASLLYTILSDADLRSAELICVTLTGAILNGADLSGANLTGANLNDSKLSGTHFANAKTNETSFANCDLSEAKGLDLVNHIGPSSIGIDAIYKSRGQIPENFLRGCGVPDGFITQMYSLIDAVDGIQFYSCFISYSSKDDEFARRLHGKMRDAHLRVWFAPEEMKGGNLLIEQIETAIRIYDKLLIVLSEASLQSEWVITELRKARNAERQTGKRKLFPVRLVDFETLRDWECFDVDSGKDLAVELREYFIPDFSHWKDHDQFEAAFARLLKDLRADERA